jgi:hypothetical protein
LVRVVNGYGLKEVEIREGYLCMYIYTYIYMHAFKGREGCVCIPLLRAG